MSKYVGKRGKVYLSTNETKYVEVFHYDPHWDIYQCVIIRPDGSKGSSIYISNRDMPSKFIDEKANKIDYTCTCGANKVGHPAHSFWCDSDENEWKWKK